jgi:uncharacterized membrane protein YccC
MALIQQHLAYPGGGFAIVERIADTFLGATLAWAFSYVLPSWERRSLPQLVARAVDALRQYAASAMEGGEGTEGAMVGQRLARRRAYDALGAVAAAFQRSAAEPERVRLPLVELAMLLDYGQRLMAHLSLIRLTLAHRSVRLEASQVASLLQRARTEIDARLRLDGRGSAAAEGRASDIPGELPAAPPVEDRLAWLARRLRVTVIDGEQVGHAASDLLAKLADSNRKDRPPAA